MLRILFATAAPFYPPYQGDSARIGAMITFFRQRGWMVDVVHCQSPFETHPDYSSMATRCDRLIVYFPTQDEAALRQRKDCDSWCPDGFAHLVGHVSEERAIDAVVVQNAFFSKCFEAINSPRRTLKIIDAEDVLTDRQRHYERLGLHYDWFSTTQEDEVHALSRANIIMAIQEKEGRAFAAMVSNAQVIIVPHAQDAPDCSEWRTHDILFVGAKNPANSEGLRRFLEGSFPSIRSQYPDAQIIIVGGVGETVKQSGDGIVLAGVIPSLDEMYKKASLVINPVVCGTGLCIKTAEALTRGKCMVTTPAGIAGVSNAEEISIVVQEPEGFGSIIVQLFAEPERIQKIGERARRFSENYFAPARAFQSLERSMLEMLNSEKILGRES